MYLEYFGLEEYPFDGLPDRRFYYVGGSQHQSLGLLTTALSRSGSICVLSGPSGVGKTTLVRMLMRSLPRRMRIITLDDPRIDASMLLASILRASGIMATSFETVADLTQKVRDMLEESIAKGVITTVICDEAQGLSDEVLEQIRLISNIEGEAGKMINFLLVGQEDLISNLNKREHSTLKNRIKIFAVLPRMKEDDVAAYLTYRMQQAGCMKPTFTRNAVKVITKKSNGVPRLINAIADMGLDLACKKLKTQVSGMTAKRAAHIVRYNSIGIKDYLRLALKELISPSLYYQIAIVVFAFICALSAFFGAVTIMERYYPLQSVENALLSDEELKERYQEVQKYLFVGSNAQSRQLYLFNQAISQAYFKSEAFANLLKLYGYASANADVVINNALLKEVDLQSLYQVGDFDEAISYNSPVLISLIDDNLIPFYAVLMQLNEDVASLIIGEHLFAVKLSYVKERYQGSYTIIHPYIGDISDLNSPKTDVRKAMQQTLRPYLEKYQQRSLESANREANAVLVAYDKQKVYLEDLKTNITKKLLNEMDTIGLSDKEVNEKLNLVLKDALAQSKEYQSALKQLSSLDATFNEKEKKARYIRSFSLKLDGGYEKAVALFLEEQKLDKLDNYAVALLSQTFSEGPRLLNVVSLDSDSDVTLGNKAARKSLQGKSEETKAKANNQD